MATYSEMLRDPRWQKRRLEIMNRAGFKCERCMDGESTLNVHHRIYRKGAMPWQYADDELQCLCEECHEQEHNIRGRLNEALKSLNQERLECVLGFAEALNALHGDHDIEIEMISFDHADGVERACRFPTHRDVMELVELAPARGDAPYRRLASQTLQDRMVAFVARWRRLREGNTKG